MFVLYIVLYNVVFSCGTVALYDPFVFFKIQRTID